MLYLLFGRGGLLPFWLPLTFPPLTLFVSPADRSEGSEVGGVVLPPVESTELDDSLAPFSLG